MKVKLAEAEGAILDWMVAKCEGKVEQGVYGTPQLWNTGLHLHYCDAFLGSPYAPSTDWAQCGPLIEREKINTRFDPNWNKAQDWGASDDIDFFEAMYGPTPLIAAMRCYVASKLGDEVEVPDELV